MHEDFQSPVHMLCQLMFHASWNVALPDKMFGRMTGSVPIWCSMQVFLSLWLVFSWMNCTCMQTGAAVCGELHAVSFMIPVLLWLFDRFSLVHLDHIGDLFDRLVGHTLMYTSRLWTPSHQSCHAKRSYFSCLVLHLSELARLSFLAL
jgi:hypothetical protein